MSHDVTSFMCSEDYQPWTSNPAPLARLPFSGGLQVQSPVPSFGFNIALQVYLTLPNTNGGGGGGGSLAKGARLEVQGLNMH